MSKRKIIHIDADKCTGCGKCIPDCPEGALQLIDGKARLVSDLFCDGLGACLGACPEDAITIEEREAEPYDEKQVMANIVTQGPGVIRAHLEHLRDHGEDEYLRQAIEYLNENNIEIPKGGRPGKQAVTACGGGGCPGSREMVIEKKPSSTSKSPTGPVQSELRQWPVQLRLLNPAASYFDQADLVIAADCVPFTYADFHRRFLKDKILVVFCPKLDRDLQEYVDKLAEIFTRHTINSITLVHMEVPCCFGVEKVVSEALKKSGRQIFVRDYTISVTGEII